MAAGRPSGPRDESERGAERRRPLEGSGLVQPLDYFPAALACLVPGFGQIVNQRHIPRQWIKGFLIAWFFWYFILGRDDPKFYPAAAILFAYGVVDFVLTRQRYNRRLAEARGRGG